MLKIVDSADLLPTFRMYNKLSHPAEKILTELTPCDGFNVDSLLKIFKISLNLIFFYIQSYNIKFINPICCSTIKGLFA